MKKVLSFILVLGMVLSLTACGNKKDRILYNVNLEKYIEVGEYKGIKVDTDSTDFKEVYQQIIDSDIQNNGLYVKKTTGKVKEGDTANIDYVGKKDGVAFEGGTAEGYDLSIGSGSFIEGFEEGLIDAKIGSTVNLNLTFPVDYGNEDLAGEDVVFTVKINYVTTDEKRKPEDFYKELDFKSVDEYYAKVEEVSIKQYLISKVFESSEVKRYPKEDAEFMLQAMYNSNDVYYQNNYGVTIKEYLESSGQTEEEYKETLNEQQVKPMMEQQMALYFILDNENLEVTKDEVEANIKEAVANVNNSQVDAEYLKEYFGEYYFENTIVSEKVMDYLYKNAKIS